MGKTKYSSIFSIYFRLFLNKIIKISWRHYLLILFIGISYVHADSSKIQITLTGTSARSYLAHLLVMLTECKFGENAECLVLSNKPTNESIPTDPTEDGLYKSAKQNNVWPTDGTEKIFSNALLQKFIKYSDDAFPGVVVEPTEIISKAAIRVSPNENWPPEKLSEDTINNVCKTYNGVHKDCVVSLEPRNLIPIPDKEQPDKVWEFFSRRFPAFRVDFPYSQEGSQELATLILNNLKKRIENETLTKPFQDDIRVEIVNPSKVANAVDTITSSQSIIDCDFNRHINGWQANSLQPRLPLLIADLDESKLDYRNYWEKDTKEVVLETNNQSSCIPDIPKGFKHSLAVAGIAKNMSPQNINFTLTREALSVRSNNDDFVITLVPGKLDSSVDIISNDESYLFSGIKNDAFPADFNSKTLDVTGPGGGVTIVAVPQKSAVRQSIVNVMETNSPFHFSNQGAQDYRINHSVRPLHELQSQPLKKDCPAWPVCLALTPFGMGVAALDVKAPGESKAKLLSPKEYLLGAGWTWIAAPGTLIPTSIKAKANNGLSKPDYDVAGAYSGSSFAVPIVGSVLQATLQKLEVVNQSDLYAAISYIATTSDLASSDERVALDENQSIDFIKLVRFGRLNIERTLNVAEKGKLSSPVIFDGKDYLVGQFDSHPNMKNSTTCKSDEILFFSPETKPEQAI